MSSQAFQLSALYARLTQMCRPELHHQAGNETYHQQLSELHLQISAIHRRLSQPPIEESTVNRSKGLFLAGVFAVAFFLYFMKSRPTRKTGIQTRIVKPTLSTTVIGVERILAAEVAELTEFLASRAKSHDISKNLFLFRPGSTRILDEVFSVRRNLDREAELIVFVSAPVRLSATDWHNIGNHTSFWMSQCAEDNKLLKRP